MADDDVDFFTMLEQHGNRLDEQRSSVTPVERPMVYNEELEMVRELGTSNIAEKYDTFKAWYLGNEKCDYTVDKEDICHNIVYKKYANKDKKVKETPMVVKISVDGVQLTIGESGAANVNIGLVDVACCALCPKKPKQRLKIVAILARAARNRQSSGIASPGPRGNELELICHMFRLKDEPSMWQFQQRFVESLQAAFPEHTSPSKAPPPRPVDQHPPIPEIPSGYKEDDFEYDPSVKSWVEIRTGVPIHEINASDPYLEQMGRNRRGSIDSTGVPDGRDRRGSISSMRSNDSVGKHSRKGSKKKKKGVGAATTVELKPYVHKIYVKSEEEILEEDARMAERLQESENRNLKTTLKAAQDEDLAKELQEQEDRLFAEQQNELEVDLAAMGLE
eukprot:m.42225 g.42225  ORF g.42225 m.42225 type:complete len:392 (+) comp9859_c0_seq3:1521-2696(+)